MTSRERMEDSERWRAVGRIEAGQSITDAALFFGVHHSVISRLWKQFQFTQRGVRRPVGGHLKVISPAAGRYFAIVAKRSSLHTCDVCGYSVRWNTQSAPKRHEHHGIQGGSNMMWARISLGYSTKLHIFKRGSVTAVRYRDEVLDLIVKLYAAAVSPTFVLMDDYARPHRADIVDDYLESERIARMAWPAYSPDLNPIENLWDALGRVVSSRFPPPATLIELKTALQEEWRLLNSAVVDHLVENMVRRYKDISLKSAEIRILS
ncbi:transposable element Tcb1 transposase [Trichonephila clavipes]|nr:transposable element Tcb1 transposase [Trichonephila clavipes]